MTIAGFGVEDSLLSCKVGLDGRPWSLVVGQILVCTSEAPFDLG
jgi:hypothetical protein